MQRVSKNDLKVYQYSILRHLYTHKISYIYRIPFLVTLKLNVTNKKNLDFESLTHFVASSDGTIDLDEAIPIGHKHYNQPDPMGVFWTMYPLDPSDKVQPPMTKSDKRFWALDVQNGLICDLKVFNGRVAYVIQPLL